MRARTRSAKTCSSSANSLENSLQNGHQGEQHPANGFERSDDEEEFLPMELLRVRRLWHVFGYFLRTVTPRVDIFSRPEVMKLFAFLTAEIWPGVPQGRGPGRHLRNFESLRKTCRG